MIIRTEKFSSSESGYDFDDGVIFSGPICNECGSICDPAKTTEYEDEAWKEENSDIYLCGKCMYKQITNIDNYLKTLIIHLNDE